MKKNQKLNVSEQKQAGVKHLAAQTIFVSSSALVRPRPPRPGPAAVTSHRWRANGSVNKRDVTRNGRRDWLRVPIPVLHEERGGGEPRGQLLCRLERREVCYCESSSWTSAHIWTGSSEEICDGGKSEEA